MTTITIHAHDKSSSACYSESIQIDGRTKEEIEKSSEDFFSSIPFEKYYYDVECFDDLTPDEEILLEELELTPDF